MHIHHIQFVLVLLILVALCYLIVAWVDGVRWSLERRCGLWALLLSRTWKVTEANALVEWREAASGAGSSLGDGAVLALGEVQKIIAEGALRAGDVVRFSLAFTDRKNFSGAKLVALPVRRANG